ncbi:unnamed protein product [Schistosoma turkestanicum]|nr:unnamed protein product [Schistosoma turkestanicum]
MSKLTNKRLVYSQDTIFCVLQISVIIIRLLYLQEAIHDDLQLPEDIGRKWYLCYVLLGRLFLLAANLTPHIYLQHVA